MATASIPTGVKLLTPGRSPPTPIHHPGARLPPPPPPPPQRSFLPPPIPSCSSQRGQYNPNLGNAGGRISRKRSTTSERVMKQSEENNNLHNIRCRNRPRRTPPSASKWSPPPRRKRTTQLRRGRRRRPSHPYRRGVPGRPS